MEEAEDVDEGMEEGVAEEGAVRDAEEADWLMFSQGTTQTLFKLYGAYPIG